jgi:hypothetical protein
MKIWRLMVAAAWDVSKTNATAGGLELTVDEGNQAIRNRLGFSIWRILPRLAFFLLSAECT